MDPSQDWFMRQLMILTDGIRGTREKGAKIEIPEPTNAIANDNVLPEILKGMVANGQIDEAENLLFRCVENYPLVENFHIGLDFYKTLAALSSEDLTNAGWSKDEIMEGISDLYQLIFNETLEPEKIFREEF